MFKLFTEKARQVIVEAKQEAQEQGHDYTGTEHILIGMLREGEGVGAIVLNSLGVELEETRSKILGIVPLGNKPLPERSPLTPHANKVCALAIQEAVAIGHNYVGTEHELLGLIQDSQPSDEPRKKTGLRIDTPEEGLFPDDARSIVGETFSLLGVDPDEVRSTTMRMIGKG